MQPSDFYFTVYDFPDGSCFSFVSMNLFNKNKCIADSGEDEAIEALLPEGQFYKVNDTTYEFEGDGTVGKQKLIDAGFVFFENIFNNNILHEDQE